MPLLLFLYFHTRLTIPEQTDHPKYAQRNHIIIIGKKKLGNYL